MYYVSEISNRDLSVLYQYRILRQPSSFLSAIYRDGEPVYAEIHEGLATDLQTDDGKPIYRYDLGISEVASKIPYLEFSCTSDIDEKRLESMLYLDGMSLYSTVSSFSNPVQVGVYWVSSLEQIRKAIEAYLQAMGKFDLDSLRDLFNARKNQPGGLPAITGRNNNLVQFTNNGEKLTLEDSGYMIESALEGQLLVNPSQELLSSLPRRLKHNINISITDGDTRYLSSFAGYTINIKGNGNWILRDMKSGVDFVSGAGEVRMWNCKLVHFRSTIDEAQRGDGTYTCPYLYAHRSLVVINQCKVADICLTGNATLIAVPVSVEQAKSDIVISKVTAIGYGCSYYSWVGAIPIEPKYIQGLAWSCNPSTNEVLLYIAGRRIDEVSSEHDAELQPSRIVEYNVDNIHIYQGGA